MADYSKTKFSQGDYFLLLIFAGVIDFLSIVPFVGTMGVFIIRSIFWFKGIRHRRMTRNLVIYGVLESVPLISVFPGTLMFGSSVYRGVKKQEREERIKLRAKRVVETKEKIQQQKNKQRAVSREEQEKPFRDTKVAEADPDFKKREPGIGQQYGGQGGNGKKLAPIFDLNKNQYARSSPYAKGSPLVEGKPHAEPKKQKRAA